MLVLLLLTIGVMTQTKHKVKRLRIILKALLMVWVLATAIACGSDSVVSKQDPIFNDDPPPTKDVPLPGKFIVITNPSLILGPDGVPTLLPNTTQNTSIVYGFPSLKHSHCIPDSDMFDAISLEAYALAEPDVTINVLEPPYLKYFQFGSQVQEIDGEKVSFVTMTFTNLEGIFNDVSYGLAAGISIDLNDFAAYCGDDPTDVLYEERYDLHILYN